MAHSYLASPCPKLRIKLMLLKVLLIVLATAISSYQRVQASGMMLVVAWILWDDFWAVSDICSDQPRRHVIHACATVRAINERCLAATRARA